MLFMWKQEASTYISNELRDIQKLDSLSQISCSLYPFSLLLDKISQSL